MKPLYCFTLLLCAFASKAQDTTAKPWSLQKEVVFWQKWQLHAPFADVEMPEYLRGLRRDYTTLPTSFTSMTDAPLRHGATYMVVKTQFRFQNKAALFADLYAEHRGASYGLFNTKNTIVYPVMRIEAKDTFSLGKTAIYAQGKAGHLLNEQMDAGLMIYNLDLQGFQVRFGIKDWWLQAIMYGDLSNSIGLNIDDLTAVSFFKEWNAASSKAGMSWVVATPPHHALHNYHSFNFFLHQQSKWGRWYAQFGYRPTDFAFTPSSALRNSAFLVGAQVQYRKKNLDFSITGEARYYGHAYNVDHYRNDTVRYRRPASDRFENYANTIGNFLYPLRKFDTPYSQWAIATELQGYNVWLLSLQGHVSYAMSQRFKLFGNYDFNCLNAVFFDKGASSVFEPVSFLYPFFDAGASYKPIADVSFSASLTNKAMNLDIAYPTHYLLRRPCLQLSVHAKF